MSLVTEPIALAMLADERQQLAKHALKANKNRIAMAHLKAAEVYTDAAEEALMSGGYQMNSVGEG